MTEATIIAVLSFMGTLLGTFGGILTANKLTTYRIEQLEKKVEKHNQVIDRVYKIEQHEAVIDEEIKAANDKISHLECYHRP